MSMENSEYDVVEMDFPEYIEEFPPIGRMISEKPFSLNKTEIYRRNAEIVLSERKRAFAENTPISAEQEEYEKLCREADKIMEQTEDIQALAENMPPDMLMNLFFNHNQEAEPEPPPEKKLLNAVITAAIILLLILLGYIAGL